MAIEHTEEMNLTPPWNEPGRRVEVKGKNEETGESKAQVEETPDATVPSWSKRVMESKAMMISAAGVGLTLVALLSSLFSFIFSSGRGVANLATKVQVTQALKDTTSDNEKARDKLKKESKEERRIIKKRVRALETFTIRLDERFNRIDARTKETHRNVQTLMRHFQLRPAHKKYKKQ